MLDSLFSSVIVASDSAVTVDPLGFAACTAASVVLGLAIAAVYRFRHDYSKNFVVTLALLPVIVQMVILLVNGNLGVGVAVMGVFSLVRFRSIAGTAKDIGSVFLAMGVGLATGMGYIGIAVMLTAVVGALNIVYVATPFSENPPRSKTLSITVPEDLQFEGVFEGVIERYATKVQLVSVRTTNMGSLYQLEYSILMDEGASFKQLLDEIRCHNGNLKVSLGMTPANREVL